MKRTSFAEMQCSVARTLEVVGEWWTMLIIREAFNGVRRFDAFQDKLGIARNVLSDRLRKLVDAGVLERRQYTEHPPRYEYRLTEKGLDLYPVLVSLLQWGDRWVAGEMGPPVVLRHRGCGHDMHASLSCDECGASVGPRDVEARPGPGVRAR
jgi:DNA-binding HxlR family transcriptional regulator